jgi:GntR family transcriptional regulator / MocR family aminotransferase
VELDRRRELQLHKQIERSLREQIRSGRLAADTQLPSTRGLASELGVSRGVVTKAYGQLAAEGYLKTSQGAPVRVAKAVPAAGLPVQLPPGPARPVCLPPRDMVALIARGFARLAAGFTRLWRSARRAVAA